MLNCGWPIHAGTGLPEFERLTGLMLRHNTAGVGTSRAPRHHYARL